jgi:hypothetical protein
MNGPNQATLSHQRSIRNPLSRQNQREAVTSSGNGARPIKRVYNITLTDPTAGPSAFAGIWDKWKRPDGTYFETFAIVTTEPNELVATIHDRLALILHPRGYDRWLTTDDVDPRLPLDCCTPTTPIKWCCCRRIPPWQLAQQRPRDADTGMKVGQQSRTLIHSYRMSAQKQLEPRDRTLNLAVYCML